ncbi:MAG: type I-C CRISPR-associated protein Cas8c/Csd1, partial [Oscillospiraceae bacterium]|nr:type I-C CRISPR-associated protein Cas8c/Csd1 [Oscillospiraceae bacterium]
MSWTNELYQIYELNYQRAYDDNEPVMLPVSHSTANAQIEITIDMHGNFKNASSVDKDKAVTIIPVTEDSDGRSSNICPHPLADKLEYIAGDYAQFMGKKFSKYFNVYMNQLQTWAESENSHPAVCAVYDYLKKTELMQDLIKSNILKLNDQTGKLLEKTKISGIAQEDAFVRFIVLYDDLRHETRTWLDTSLYESFIKFNSGQVGNIQLCYATGKVLPVTYKHPSKIRNSNPLARLISANDEKVDKGRNGFTYRGRFANKTEASSVSYEFSQKMHNALKWLIQKQGQAFGSLTLLIWASALQPVPNEIDKYPVEDDWYDDDETEIPDTLPLYKIWLSRYLTGYRQKFEEDTKIMIMGLDAATTGRLSISLYDELQGSEFLNHLENWHENSAWRRFDGKHNLIKSFSLYEIIKSAYGTEQSGKLECDEKIIRDQILCLLPCVMNGRRIPEDLIQSLYHKA